MTRHLYDKKYFRKSHRFQTSSKRIKPLCENILKYEPKVLLDVGCGIGSLVGELRKHGVEAYGTDFADTLKKTWNKPYYTISDARNLPFADATFDTVISTEFFEHVPEEQIEEVFLEMERVCTGKILADIAYEDTLDRIQANYHVTNKPESWWRQKLPRVILI